MIPRPQCLFCLCGLIEDGINLQVAIKTPTNARFGIDLQVKREMFSGQEEEALEYVIKNAHCPRIMWYITGLLLAWHGAGQREDKWTRFITKLCASDLEWNAIARLWSMPNSSSFRDANDEPHHLVNKYLKIVKL